MILRSSRQRRALLLGCLLVLTSAGAMADMAASPNEEIRYRFEALTSGIEVTAAQDSLLAGEALRKFYEERNFGLAWFHDGRLRPEALELLRTVDRSAGEGLQPEDYHQEAIARQIENLTSGSSLAAQIDLDLLLSDAFLLLGSHLLAGKVNPETLMPEWTSNRRGLEMASLLAQALETGSVEAMLDTLRPRQPGYQQLRDERKRIAELVATGRWEAVPPGPLIHPGSRDPRLALIRTHLIALGDHTRPDMPAVPLRSVALADPHLYDIELLAAVSRFQARHGLDPNGVIGPDTVAELNTPPRERLTKIEINLERWRWMPEQLGSLHVLINLAGSELHVVSEQQPILSTLIVLGSNYRQTPPFSDEIQYIVLNPAWTLSPHHAAYSRLTGSWNADSLGRLGFRAYKGWGDSRVELDLNKVSKSEVPEEASDLQLVQMPGPQNALGQVKIMFSNSFDLYLHDEPAEGPFSLSEERAAYDSVRVKDALTLVDALLGEESGWDRSQLKSSDGARAESRTLFLKQPIPVHIQYLTAWTDADGVLQLRKDLFGRDQALERALKQAPQ